MKNEIHSYLDRKKSKKLTTTIPEAVYQNIREAILKRKLKPGQRLKIGEIATFLNVSQTPVREAFQRLAAENFLIIEQRSKIRVSEIGLEEGVQWAELIQLLDVNGIETALPTITPEDITDLEDMTRRLEGHFRNRSLDLYLTQNYRIHKRLWQTYANPVIIVTLGKALETLTSVESRYQSFCGDPKFLENSYLSHRRLMDALTRRDSLEAKAILSCHWIYE
jgi:DNA-binding GntR family transcriptional regulator